MSLNSVPFEKWIRLKELSVGHLPDCGDCCSVYAFRDSRNQEIIKFGETEALRRRLFGNFIGGLGGKTETSTTQRVHLALFEISDWINHIEVSWIVTKDKAEARQMERDFRANFKKDHGRRPIWDLQD